MRTIVGLSAIVIGLLGAASPASAQPTVCTGSINGGIHAGIIVPEGVTCGISNATVNGSIEALEDSKTFKHATTVYGHVSAQDAEVLQIIWSEVFGNVDVIGGEADDFYPYTYDFAFCGSRVRGNLSIQDSGGDVFMYASSNCSAPWVDGNLRVSGVRARVVLHDLTVGRNMTVVDNTGTVLNSVQNNTVGRTLTWSRTWRSTRWRRWTLCWRESSRARARP